jgi:hypothetical protein
MSVELQRVLLDSRTNCAQCGTYSTVHKHCRCRSCGRIHAVGKACRAPKPASALPSMCGNRGTAHAEQSNGRCLACRPISASQTESVGRVPSVAHSEVATSLCPQCNVLSFPHSYCLCQHCGFVHASTRDCRSSRLPALFRAAVTAGMEPVLNDVGAMDIECSYCGSRSWPTEKISCCAHGSLQLPPMPPVPSELSQAILATHVRQHIRSYNMAMAMASVGHTNISLPDGTFVLGGRAYHRVGSLLPLPGEMHAFAQIYVLDADQASERRAAVMGGTRSVIRRDCLERLHTLLSVHNACVQQFVQAANSDAPHLIWRSQDDLSSMQIGAIVAEPGTRRDIVVRKIGGTLQFIDDGHPLYHPLAYPLLFPLGTAGWSDSMQVANMDYSNIRRITLAEWGRYFLMHRDSVSHVQRCERLALEFYCDLWAQVESRNAQFHRSPAQQAKYRGARVAAMEDQLSSGVPAGEIGNPVVRLPSSFVGSARFYQQLYLDAMALPRHFGKPDLFITMTCNPHWPEIQSAVPLNSHWRHHPDIVARVFVLKMRCLIKDIVKMQIFGKVRAYVYRVEWQARGLVRHVAILRSAIQ